MTTLAAIDPQNLFTVRFFWLKVDGLIVILSYLMGSIPFGYLIAKSRGIDIRQHGSGNIGATNVMRVLGKKPGYMAFACDTLKGLVAVLVGKYIAQHHTLTFTQGHEMGGAIYHETYFVMLPESIGAISAAVACIIGHNFPVWLGFKGGKGMATSGGVLMGMIWQSAATCMGLWVVVFYATRYVSLASLAASIALPLVTMIFLFFGVIHGWPYFYFTVAACMLAVWRHRSNIVRLMNGTENRFEKKGKGELTTDEHG